MRVTKKTAIRAAIWAASAMIFGLGWLWDLPTLAAGGAIGLGYLLLRLTSGKRARPTELPKASPPDLGPAVKCPAEPTDPNNVPALVERMLAQGRYALLLRPQIARNLGDDQLARARKALEEQMALVPDGEVVLGGVDEALDDGRLDEEEIAAYEGRVVRVERFFLDRYPVTNRQFSEFVAGGGYQQIALWDQLVWPAVLDFVDETGQPGPRFWKNGWYQPGQDDHPVVGVSWCEAVAYARWLGKRLPTDAEWVKAGSWPVSLSANTRVQRRYPWGNTMDRSRANVWGSGPKGTVPVNAFSQGVSVGGVYQLIGNVWEWTLGDLSAGDAPHRDLMLDVPMKSLRGGAFDTYFDNQATCQFQSGDVAMARKRNIGFRCAVGVCDVVLARHLQCSPAASGLEGASVEEVHV